MIGKENYNKMLGIVILRGFFNGVFWFEKSVIGCESFGNTESTHIICFQSIFLLLGKISEYFFKL